MKLFKRKRQSLNQKQVHTAEKIADKILHGQRRAADYLNHKTEHVSQGTWRVLLITFCILFGGYCFYLLAQVFN